MQTSAVGVQYCTGSYLSVTPVDQLGKQLDVRFYYVAFTLSQGSLHYPGRSLHMNFTNIAFVSIQFSFKILSFLLSFKASVKRYFTFLSGCIYRMWLRIYCDGVLLPNIACNKIFYTASSYVNELTFTPIVFF